MRVPCLTQLNATLLSAVLVAAATVVSVPVQAQEPTLFSGSWTETLGLDLAAEDPQEDVATLRSR